MHDPHARSEPSPIVRRAFGLILLAAAAAVGWWLATRWSAPACGWTVAGVGLLIALTYYAVPPLQHRIYRASGRMLQPLVTLLSRVLFTLVWWLLLTPIALIRRLLGSDPLRRRADPDAVSWWIDS